VGTASDVVVSGGVLSTSEGTDVTALNAETGTQPWQVTQHRLQVLDITRPARLLAVAAHGVRQLRRRRGRGWLRFGAARLDRGAGLAGHAVDTGTGSRDFSSAQYADQIQGFPLVVDAGRVYLSTGNEVVCYALPGAA
jgi:hypothetical protein